MSQFIRGNPPTFSGATSSANGLSGLVPAPTSADIHKALKGDGTWGEVTSTDVIAPDYDPTATYEYGDVVGYERNLYRCITNIETAEAWTAAHWELTTVMNEIQDNYIPANMFSFPLNPVNAYGRSFGE